MSTIQQRRPQQPSTVSSEKVLQSNAGPSDTTPVVSGFVIKTLLGFTAAMVIVPIGSYFVTVNTIFKGNTSYAGGLAALMANVVLIGYILVAYLEDQDDQNSKGKGLVGTGVRASEQKKEK